MVREELGLIVFESAVVWGPEMAQSCLDPVTFLPGVAMGTGHINMELSEFKDFSRSLHQRFSLKVAFYFFEVIIHVFHKYLLSPSLRAMRTSRL